MIGTDILLRATEPADIETIYRWENDTELWKYGNTLAPYSRHAIEQFVMNVNVDLYASRQLRLMIDWCQEGKDAITVGTIDLFDLDPHHRRAAIGILIDKPYRSNGFAQQALQMMINYTFNILHLHQLYCNILKNNAESIKLFTNAGFVACGVLKDWSLKEGVWVDEIMMQLINSHKN